MRVPRYKYSRRDLVIPEAEVEAMIIGASHLWLQAMIAFLYIYGCRVSEALGVQLRDCSMEGGYLRVRIGVLKKRVKGPFEADPHQVYARRQAPFMRYLMAYIQAVSKGGSLERELWPYSRQWVWQKIKALNPKVSPHAFRHSRLQDLADRGATPWELRDWAGWRDTRPAEAYVQRSGRTTKRLADKIV